MKTCFTCVPIWQVNCALCSLRRLSSVRVRSCPSIYFSVQDFSRPCDIVRRHTHSLSIFFNLWSSELNGSRYNGHYGTLQADQSNAPIMRALQEAGLRIWEQLVSCPYQLSNSGSDNDKITETAVFSKESRGSLLGSLNNSHWISSDR